MRNGSETWVSLRQGHVEVDLAPDIGGSVVNFRAYGVDIFRPTSDAAVERRDSLGFACFPMTPFVNRIPGGRFKFGERKVSLPSPRLPHALHGYGWLEEWTVESATLSDAVLSWRSNDGNWPWRCRSEQVVRLEEDALAIDLSIENLDDQPMPSSLGLHPFFPGLAEAELKADMDGAWLTDDDLIPVEWVTLKEAPVSFDKGLPLANTDLDNCFTGFDGIASIVWPRRGIEVAIEAPGCRFLQVFTRGKDGAFCVEAQTAMPDGVNRLTQARPDLTGMTILGPGDRLQCTTRFVVKRRA